MMWRNKPGREGETGLDRVTCGSSREAWLWQAHTRPTPVSPGTVPSSSSLFTYDSQFLVDKFLNQPKHDPNFKPLFPNEITLSPSQAEEMDRLCERDHFCTLDMISTGDPSVGNATRAAHQLHQQRLKSLQPGREREGGAQGWTLRAAEPCSVASSSGLSSVLCPIPVVSCGWLPPPSNGHKEGLKYLVGSTVRFSCKSGYGLVGSETSTCRADGTWSTPTPECQPGEMPPLP